MSYAIEPQIYERFRGIREYNGISAGGDISALTCNNVEFIQSEVGNNVSIKSAYGNQLSNHIDGYKIIEIFESKQNGVIYTFIYAENDTEGKIYYIGLDNVLKELRTASNKAITFSVTGKCNAVTMSTSAYDVFVITNGKEVRTICFTDDTAYADVVEGHNPVTLSGGYMATITPVDNKGRDIEFISMDVWNGFLVVASQYGVHSSNQTDIYKWNDDPTSADITTSWYIEYSKPTTAVKAFAGGLYIFTADDVSFLNTTPNDSNNSTLRSVSMNGCFSYKSLVQHDLYLFFYDEKQKNIYYLTMTDTTGQSKPSGPVAKEIQSYFNNVTSFKMYSCVYNSRNEIWCIINDNILIFDYARQEWITRQAQNITTFALINNQVYSGDDLGNIYIENMGDSFNNDFFKCEYQTTYINLGSNTNMKKQKTPLLLTLDASYTNDFYVQLICNNKEKTPKHIFISNSNASTYVGDDEENVANSRKFSGELEDGTYFKGAKFAPEVKYNKRVVEVSTPQTWYTLSIKIFTEEIGQGFCINSMELKNIKGKTKTKGR